ncbi:MULTISPECIES: hypothetical protein [unclassified Microbacterium]|uniref:hypothetical protein n=1 Tax=unclassified Microbacterium TaxID=2609290 RepID=UPI00214B63BE|nr:MULTISPECIES: hypothetical protein [unclassified Microbacterium]MCR2785332.1 hypothetical protein [Microbacterium sp. zg.B96]MDL5353033.1 hypothetical protein [Microbacterium sp. zg-YB36]WIM16861.1 hypothetical protein QNO11_04240 [Microbacterium sp. zg-B96]
MTPSPVSSTPLLRTTLVWSAAVTGVLAVIGAFIGYAVGGAEGLWSALGGIVLAFVFLGITGASILIANRWYGDALYVPIFFAIVLGGWIVKFGVFIVVLLVLRGQPWLNPTVFFVALIVGIIASLIIDVIVMLRMRIPHASDVRLPNAGEIDDPADGPAERI